MANPFFKAMGGKQTAHNPMMSMAQQFRQFMQQMQGRDPNQMLSELISSGKVSQEQLNQAQQRLGKCRVCSSSLRECSANLYIISALIM